MIGIDPRSRSIGDTAGVTAMRPDAARERLFEVGWGPILLPLEVKVVWDGMGSGMSSLESGSFLLLRKT